jgi:hypothetical protein
VRYANPNYRYKERKLPISPEWLDVLDEYLAQYEVRDTLFDCTARNLEYILTDVGERPVWSGACCRLRICAGRPFCATIATTPTRMTSGKSWASPPSPGVKRRRSCKKLLSGRMRFAHIKLPIFTGIIQPRLKPFALLIFGDVEEEFENPGAAVMEHPLKVIDMLIAGPPDRFGNDLIHTYYQHIFIMGAVKDANQAAWRDRLVYAPEKVAGQLMFGGHFERFHAHPLGIDTLQNVANDAILATGVDSLKDKQQALFVFGIKPLLPVDKFPPQLAEFCFGLLPVIVEGAASGGNIFQAQTGSLLSMNKMCIGHEFPPRITYIVKLSR